MSKTQPIRMYEAIQRMRDLTELNIPFSFSFVTYNSSNQLSNGLKEVSKALLRKGYRANQSKKSNVLIAYYDCDNQVDNERQFYLPLLISFNNKTVLP